MRTQIGLYASILLLKMGASTYAPLAQSSYEKESVIDLTNKVFPNLKNLGARSLQICEDTANGGTDDGGDSCVWYRDNSSSCGVYDDADFVANSVCCACGGGNACQDSTNGATDSAGDDCSWYSSSQEYCGSYDDDDFSAMGMCCVCTGEYEQGGYYNDDPDSEANHSSDGFMFAIYIIVIPLILFLIGFCIVYFCYCQKKPVEHTTTINVQLQQQPQQMMMQPQPGMMMQQQPGMMMQQQTPGTMQQQPMMMMQPQPVMMAIPQAGIQPGASPRVDQAIIGLPEGTPQTYTEIQK